MTVCAAVFKPICSGGSGPGWCCWAGFISRDATLQCKEVFSFVTLGAPQHLHLSLDFRAISGGGVRPWAGSEPWFPSAGSSGTPLSFCTISLQKSQTLDIVNCTCFFFCLLFFS